MICSYLRDISEAGSADAREKSFILDVDSGDQVVTDGDDWQSALQSVINPARSALDRALGSTPSYPAALQLLTNVKNGQALGPLPAFREGATEDEVLCIAIHNAFGKFREFSTKKTASSSMMESFTKDTLEVMSDIYIAWPLLQEFFMSMPKATNIAVSPREKLMQGSNDRKYRQQEQAQGRQFPSSSAPQQQQTQQQQQ